MVINNKTLKITLLLIVLFFLGVVLSQISYFRLNITQAKWQWIREKILLEPRKKIDFVIIGSSHSFYGIQPNLISKTFNGATVYNLSRYYEGRDADYFIIKELAKHHRVKNILLEFRNRGIYMEHHSTPLIITFDDIINELFYYINQVGFTSRFKNPIPYKIKLRINKIIGYTRSLIFRNVFMSFRMITNKIKGKKLLTEKVKTQFDSSNGFQISMASKIDPNFIKNYKPLTVKNKLKKSKKYVKQEGTKNDFYLKKIYSLACKYRIKLHFIYLPRSHERYLPHQNIYEFYDQFGDVLLPNINNLFQVENWYDGTHLSFEGSEKFTKAVIYLLKNRNRNSIYHFLYEVEKDLKKPSIEILGL